MSTLSICIIVWYLIGMGLTYYELKKDLCKKTQELNSGDYWFISLIGLLGPLVLILIIKLKKHK
jgi:hypothetical protein